MERLRSATRRMYKRVGADEGIAPLACRRREYARALPFAERAGVSAQASEQRPQQQRTERPCSAIRRMYKRAGADEGIVPLAYRRRSTPALCHSQNVRACPRKRRNNIPNSSERNARARQFSERATVLADADAFDRPLRFRITRREGKDEHPFLFVLESPIYKSFRRKKPAPALHTAIYHTRRKRRLTAAVRLCKNGRHCPTYFLVF